MRTVIIIRHTTAAQLKSHPLWSALMALFLTGDAVEVESIGLIEPE